jgi:hypothetical protein
MSTLGTFALASAPYQGLNGAYKRPCLLQVVVTFAAGAPSINVARSAPGFTIADGASGAYTGTAPKAARGVMFIQPFRAVDVDSASVDVVAYSPTAGTFTLQAYVNDAPADIDDGDELWILFLLEGG